MQDKDRYCEIIELIYDTVDKPSRWKDVLEALSDFSRSTHSFLTERKGVHGEPVSFYDSGFSKDYFRKYGEYFYKVDVWSQNLARFTPNQFHESHKVCDDNEFLHSEIYSDFAKPENIRHSIGLFLGDPYSNTTTEMAFMRSIGQPHYEASTVRTINQFIPHIKQVQNLSRRLYKLELKNSKLEDLVNNLDEAVFLTDKHLKIEYCNQFAERLLEHSNLFSGYANNFRFKQVSDQDQLKVMALQILDITTLKSESTKKHMLVYDNKQAYLMSISPWRHSRIALLGDYPEFGIKISLLPINARRLPHTSDLASIFNLTLAEADVLSRVCRGEPLVTVAKKRGTQLSTTRQQLKQILQKTDCTSQVELVIKVLSQCLI